MGKLFVIGGKNKLERYDRPCVFYDKQSSIWHSFAPMIESRQNAACTVFEGKIVVSGGGYSEKDEKNNEEKKVDVEICLKTIEAYDYHENKWSSLPCMLSPRTNHTAVSISNKLFMIGGCSRRACYDNFDVLADFEVFDRVNMKFTSIQRPPMWNNSVLPFQAVCIGYKIVVFQGNSVVLDRCTGCSHEIEVFIYDVETNDFKFKTSFYLRNNKNFSCTKVSRC